MVTHQFDVVLVRLDPTIGSEIRKSRPCVVITPDEMNRHLQTVLVAPLTSTLRDYPFRVTCSFAGRKGQIALDQIRCIDRLRLLKHLGHIDDPTAAAIRATLGKMFG